MPKQFSPASERNGDPILAVLLQVFADRKRVLEIGSGTGQHAVFFGERLPHLIWQTSDLPENHASILAWQQDAQLPNVLPPFSLDVASDIWPQHDAFDAVFTANTCHIMAWREVEAMFKGVAHMLSAGGLLCIYGPFNYRGAFTSDSNARFDALLKSQAQHMGIRDIEAIERLANDEGMALEADHAMPANNRLLVLRRC